MNIHFIEKENKELFFMKIETRIQSLKNMIEFIDNFPSFISCKNGNVFNKKIVNYINKENEYGILFEIETKENFGKDTILLTCNLKSIFNTNNIYILTDKNNRLLSIDNNLSICKNSCEVSNNSTIQSLKNKLNELENIHLNYEKYLDKINELGKLIEETNKIPKLFLSNLKTDLNSNVIDNIQHFI